MNVLATLFLIANAIALLALPRRWAALPLLLGACYMTAGQRLQIGPFNFTVLRLLFLVGIARVCLRGEWLPGGWVKADALLVVWAAWLVLASLFHSPVADVLVLHLGAAYNALALYFLIRIFCATAEDSVQLVKIAAITLVPVVIEMAHEVATGQNLFAFFGGVPPTSLVRDGHYRAQGPFGHSILAGTVGGLCVPLMIGIWRQHRRIALIGLTASVCMVFLSRSSGPILAAVFGVMALLFWRWRHLRRWIPLVAVCLYLLLEVAMNSPPYFIIAKIDLTGSSASWHRAELIRQAIEHLGEWWFAGTDYTRHWMPYGVSFSGDYCDITNHYLYYGVWAGLPGMLLFMGSMALAFRYVSKTLDFHEAVPNGNPFLIWAFASGLFAHALTCLSVAYFEQSVLFLYLYLAGISSLYAVSRTSAVPASEPQTEGLGLATFSAANPSSAASSRSNLSPTAL